MKRIFWFSEKTALRVQVLILRRKQAKGKRKFPVNVILSISLQYASTILPNSPPQRFTDGGGYGILGALEKGLSLLHSPFHHGSLKITTAKVDNG